MKKLTKKLMLSILTVALTFIALGTSTFAWFSVNNTVTATGMTVNTRVSNNLFIANTTIAATDPVAETNFAAYLHKEVSGLLEPVSSIDGLNFFYTDAANNVKADGSVRTATYTALNTSKALPTDDQLTAFRAANGANTSVGWVDYIFELKAVNAETTAQALKLTKLDLVYNGLPTSEKAFRAAVFMEKYNGSDYTMVSEATMPAAKSIFFKSSAAYFTTNSAVNSTSGVSTVLTPNTAVTVNVASGQTEYYKVVIRLWLEGEDTTCENTKFASLTNNWALDLEFVLGTEKATISNLGSTAITASVESGNVARIELSDGKLSNNDEPAAYLWYNAETGAAASGTNNASTYTATESGVYYCRITTTKGTVYYTEGLTLTVA